MNNEAQSTNNKNFFEGKLAAFRYSRARPYFHPHVIKRISRFIERSQQLPCALDVGCGTGQSTIALLAIAERAIGIDSAPQMLAYAPPVSNVLWLQARAEALPIADSSIDVITVSLAYHWFHSSTFLSEAHRVLRNSGWLVIYSNVFDGKALNCPSYTEWHKQVYEKRFPLPPRSPYLVNLITAEECGFINMGTEYYVNTVNFKLERFTEYLMSRTNVIGAVKRGETTHDRAFAEITSELKYFFKDRSLTFEFHGDIQYLRRKEDGPAT
ncbi:MAG TPA: class I SAM-dependent methyltransferase [Pyrinomonadaceae bacterium]